MKIMECSNCGYRGLINVDRKKCRHCKVGNLEIIASEKSLENSHISPLTKESGNGK